jgi:tRNA dimethylallyltransferase
MNDLMQGSPRIVCVIGPTGSGKNNLALRMSEFFPLEIINFDSRQVYSDLPIITAQPSEEDKKVCPHHLYGFLGLCEKINAGRFTDMARQAVREVCAGGGIPFLVGGTGLYLRSLIYGLADIPAVPENIQDELENECRAAGVQTLYQRLSAADPDYSRTITSKDRQKIIRALGVYMASGKPFSRWHLEQNKTPFCNALKLGIHWELDQLTPLLEKRISIMIRNQAVEEVEKAWQKSGHDPSCPAFSGIGCRELISCIQGKTDLKQSVDLWLKNTRAYAKRQLTWFRNEPGIAWIGPGDTLKGVDLVKNFLKKSGSKA